MMPKNSTKKRAGLGGIAHLVIAVFVAIIGYKISLWLVPDDLKSIPWGVITVLLLPTGYGVTFLTKLSEVKTNTVDLLSRSEIRHLEIILNHKKSWAYMTLCFQFMIVAANIILSIGSLPESLLPYNKVILCWLIGLTITSLYLILPFILGVSEINDFVAKVKERQMRKKRTDAAIKKLRNH
ncbi:hypothetical protein [Morganella morganii]|uniref:hypothetical protein n=1 Tax=Morganella morganii TaxID=582 RepID=UPI0011177A54|nr:hypothetical protein [Morganella morganii]HBN5713686.1 hypothetical protein [Morganella morganii]